MVIVSPCVCVYVCGCVRVQKRTNLAIGDGGGCIGGE